MTDNNYVFFPEIKDREIAGRLAAVEVIQILKKANFPPEYVYAWYKCGFFHPKIVDSFCKAAGLPISPTRLSKEEIRKWDKAVREYRKKGGEIPTY